MKNLKLPTNELVEEYNEKFETDERYYFGDQAIIKLFAKFPHNNKIEDVLLKISVINDLYSTNIFSTFKMAKHILSLNIDKELLSANSDIISRIATGHGIPRQKDDGDRNFYSFATKYCSWHNPDQYPIYDNYVHRILWDYQQKDKFSDFKRSDIKDFPIFKRIMIDFKSAYRLNEHNLKSIDKFLWIYGKEIYKRDS